LKHTNYGREGRLNIGRPMGKSRLLSRLILYSLITSLILLAGVSFVSLSHAGITADIEIKVRIVSDLFAPAPVTDLAAVSGVTEGSINLSWTAPAEDGAMGGGAVSSYILKYATFSVNNLAGDTTAWWSHPQTLTALDGGSPKEPGEIETFLIGGLTPGATFYFAIKSRDDGGNVSPIDTKTSALNQANAATRRIPPAAITDLIAQPGAQQGQVVLTWTEVGDDGTTGNIVGGRYGVKYSSNPGYDWDGPSGFKIQWPANTIPGRTGNLTIGNLTPGATYYFRIWTRDEAFNWSDLSNGATTWVQVGTNYPPSPPTGLVAKAGNREVTLTWTANTEADMKSYWVYRSTESGSYDYGTVLSTVTHPTTKYIDKGLTNDTTYYYVLRAVDTYGLVSSSSYEVAGRPGLRPRQLCGVKGTMVDGGKYIKIEWKEVTRNEDGSPCNDLESYRVYRSVSLDGFDDEARAVVSKSVQSWKETENIIGKTYYYKVRAADIGGVESADSMLLMVEDEKVNVIALSENMRGRLFIPEELTDTLYEETNSYDADLNIWIGEKVEEENKDRVVSCYEFSAFKGYAEENLEQIDSFSFARPKASVSLAYEVSGQGVVKGTNIRASQVGKQLALFWFNGIEWVKLGARADTVEQVLSIKTKKLGRYKIKESFTATEFTLNKVYPAIFTPNDDGLNDVANFEYANPNNKGVVCRIFDIRGALVRQLDIGQTETSFIWDGKDEKGRVAPSGVYIYQLEAEGKVINGTIILAK